jgi:pimeloyl-ACP methyl ester carboxylesterase
MHLAVTRPSLVRSLTVFEPVLFSLLAERDPQGPAALEVLDVAQTVRGYVSAGQPSRAAEHFVTYWSGAHAWQRLSIQQQAAIASRMPMVTLHFDAIYAASLSPDRLARLRMPVLCLSGSRSTAAARQISALLRTLMPQAKHETLDELGHLGPITHPQVVNDRVMKFLELGRPDLPMVAT